MANQAWQLTKRGVITLIDRDTLIPKPGPKQVLVRIYAAAWNPGDIMLANGSDRYPVQAPIGRVL
ncbi:hypothetical protein LTR53_020335, partial [Teratosphaeriaceae sp. CCFEE 6253]